MKYIVCKTRSNLKLSFIIGLLSLHLGFSQQFSVFWDGTGSDMKVKSPEVSGLNLPINDKNIDFSTGTIQPSIPLSILNCRSLSDGFTLRYINGKGVRINDIASDIGLGWEAQLGGYITREVKGFPDEQKIWADAAPGVPGETLVNSPNAHKEVNGWLDFADWDVDGGAIQGGVIYTIPKTPLSTKLLAKSVQELGNSFNSNTFPDYFRVMPLPYIPPQDPVLGALAPDLGAFGGMGWATWNADGEPDIFYFKIKGYSGKFVFDGEGVPTIIPHNPEIKISPAIGPNASNEWIITTGDGTKFYFGVSANYTEKVRTETETTPYYDDWYSPTPDRNEGIHVNEYTSKWLLRRMESPNGDWLEYEYETLPKMEHTIKSDVQQDFHVPTSYEGVYALNPPDFFPHSGDDGFTSRTTPRNTQYIINAPKRMLRVNSSCDSSLELIYNGTGRDDLKNSGNRKALSSIRLLNDHTQIVEQYNFDTRFFGYASPTLPDYEKKRLKLNKITKVKDGNSFDSFAFEYNEQNILPERNSPKQDFWGYYNANPYGNLIPKINHNNAYERTLDGADRTPNETLAKTFALRTIIYPTKGSIEYEYELNEYWDGSENQKTGGLRIKKITRDDLNGNKEIITYKYHLPTDEAKSSGQIPQHLRQWKNNAAGRLFEKQVITIWTGHFSQPETKYIYVTRFSNPKYLQTSDLIRYSDVTIDFEGNGRTEYHMTSFETNPDIEKLRYEWEPSGVDWSVNAGDFYTYSESTAIPWGRRGPSPTVNLTDQSYFRGLILNEKHYNEAGILNSELINEYEFDPANYQAKNIFGFGIDSNDNFFVETQEISSINIEVYTHNNDFFFKKKTTERIYDESDPLAYVDKISTYFHDNPDHLLTTSVETTNSDNEILKTEMQYAHELNLSRLISENRIIEPIKTESFKKEQGSAVERKISATNTNFKDFNGLYLPEIIQTSKGLDILKDRITYHRYDDKGNPLEVSRTDGPNVVYLWGYNKQHPIAKIESTLTYDEINQDLNLKEGFDFLTIQNKSNEDNDNCGESNCKEEILREHLNAIRDNFPEAMVTTYTYDPLVGVTSITDPRGYTMTYIYDVFNRLQEVRDDKGNLITDYKYNYAAEE